MLDSLLVTLIVMFLAWFWKKSQHSKKFPPGPRFPVPVLGDAYVLGDDLEKGFKKLILKHGKICGLWLGPQRAVVVADFEILQEVLNKAELSDRQHWALENLSAMRNGLMPSPSAFSKFGLSMIKFFKHAQFFMYTQNHFGILKS